MSARVVAIGLAGTVAVAAAPPRSPGARSTNARDAQVAPVDKRSGSPSSTPAVVGPEGRRIVVPLADPVPWTLPAEGTPPGWNVKEFTGHADVELVRVDGQLAVRLRSDRSSFALYRDVVLRLDDFPVVTWSWKVMRLPRAGDVRVRGRDDQAAQLYVIFPRWPSPLTRSDVIGYVWDTTAPIDTRLASPRAKNVQIIVVDSGRSEVGVWRRYARNVADDYAALFGRKPPRVGKVAIMVDSNDTRSDAEVFVGPIGFARGPRRAGVGLQPRKRQRLC